jgi:hypothetical protein
MPRGILNISVLHQASFATRAQARRSDAAERIAAHSTDQGICRMCRARGGRWTMAEIKSSKQATWVDYLVCYALYILLILGGVAALIMVVRPAILALIVALLGNSQANRIIYLASITLLGLGLFILIMAAEPYLRNGIERRQLLRRFIRIATPVIVAGILGALVLALVG